MKSINNLLKQRQAITRRWSRGEVIKFPLVIKGKNTDEVEIVDEYCNLNIEKECLIKFK